MSDLQEIKAKVDQVSPSVLEEGSWENVRMSKLGQLFTVDWKQRLALAGMVHTLNLGTIGGEGSYSALTGNAAYDNNQPEVVIAIDSGWLIPLEIDIGISVNDMDAYNDFTEILFMSDRSQTVPAGETGTEEVALNNLDGGDSFNGRCYSIIAGDTTNVPLGADILAYEYQEVTITASESGGSVPATMGLYKKFDVPIFLAGPCSIIGYVVGNADGNVTFMGSVTFAHVPTSWVATS